MRGRRRRGKKTPLFVNITTRLDHPRFWPSHEDSRRAKKNGPHFRTGVDYERAIAEGSYTKDEMWSYYGLADNTISSLKVPRGWKVTLYDGGHFDSASGVYTSDVRNLGKLDNAVSSLKVERTEKD